MAAWFGRKKISVGWGRATWQSTLTLAVYVVFVIAIGLSFPVQTAPGSYCVAIGVATLALLITHGKLMAKTETDDPGTWPHYMTNEGVQRAIQIAQQVANWNENMLYGIEFHASEPDRMSAIAFAVVHEHQKSCLMLTKSGLVASATALMRPSFEAFMRGLWLQWATDEELLRFQRGEDSLNLERAIKLIVERSGVARYKDLRDMWMQSKRTLHGYVHHSYQSLIRRSGVIDVPAEEIASLLNFSSALATHASIEITELADKFAPLGHEVERRDLVNELQMELVATLGLLGLANIPPEEG